MICDLNLVYPQEEFDVFPGVKELNKLKGCLAVLEQLGYTHIALNFEPKWTSGEINKHIPGDIHKVNPINVDRDFAEFRGRLKIYSRITLKIDDPSQCQNITKFQQVFDIVAVEPQTERALQLAITNLEVDIITFNYRERLPCYLKHKTITCLYDLIRSLPDKSTSKLQSLNAWDARLWSKPMNSSKMQTSEKFRARDLSSKVIPLLHNKPRERDARISCLMLEMACALAWVLLSKISEYLISKWIPFSVAAPIVLCFK